MSAHLVEIATNLILTQIKDNIADALTVVRTNANLGQNLGLPTPPPREYFIARNQKALQCPAVYVISKEIDFKKDRGANFIAATGSYEIAIVVEAQTTEDAARMTWRYQTALRDVLDNRSLTSADQALRIVCIVRGAAFTEEYDPSENPGKSSAIWRKGALIRVDVEFYEAN